MAQTQELFSRLPKECRDVIIRYVNGFVHISFIDRKNSSDILKALHSLHPQATEALDALNRE
jgi:hypothetical protein